MRHPEGRAIRRSFWDRQTQARMLGAGAVAAFALSLPLMIGLLVWMYTVVPRPVQPTTVQGTRTYYPRLWWAGRRPFIELQHRNLRLRAQISGCIFQLAGRGDRAGIGFPLAATCGERDASRDPAGWPLGSPRHAERRRATIASCRRRNGDRSLRALSERFFAGFGRWNQRIRSRHPMEYAGVDRDAASLGVSDAGRASSTRCAHEMSHLANDDMRLNLWMTSIIGGMMAFDGFARTIARIMGTTLVHPQGGPAWRAKDASESRRSIGLVGSIVMTLIGLALTLLDFYLVRLPRIAGCVGLFMGAAASGGREPDA